MFSSEDFPSLHPGNHQVTSPPSARYNCIAWAIGRHDQWWDPGETAEPDIDNYWPSNAPRDYNLTSLIVAYESVGFVLCVDGIQEEGVEKIALFADGVEYMHAARQLDTGKWTSKLGYGEDIEHDTPKDVAGPAYGQVAVFMKRERAAGPDS